jgi:hypothetical protein
MISNLQKATKIAKQLQNSTSRKIGGKKSKNTTPKPTDTQNLYISNCRKKNWMGIQKKKETEDRENPPRQQTLSKPFCFQEQNPPEILKNHHSLHETFSFTDIPCKDPCCKGTKNFPSNDLFSLPLPLSLDRSLSRPRGHCGRLSRQNNGNDRDCGE